jgi:hypothetical protein
VDAAEVYAKDRTDALGGPAALVGTLTARLAKHDTNPAENPQPLTDALSQVSFSATSPLQTWRQA